MPMQSTFVRTAAEIAICATLLLAIDVTARAGEVRDHRSGSGGGGVTVTNTSNNGGGSGGTVRDHRSKPIVCVVGPFDPASKCQ